MTVGHADDTRYPHNIKSYQLTRCLRPSTDAGCAAMLFFQPYSTLDNNNVDNGAIPTSFLQRVSERAFVYDEVENPTGGGTDQYFLVTRSPRSSLMRRDASVNRSFVSFRLPRNWVRPSRVDCKTQLQCFTSSKRVLAA